MQSERTNLDLMAARCRQHCVDLVLLVTFGPGRRRNELVARQLGRQMRLTHALEPSPPTWTRSRPRGPRTPRRETLPRMISSTCCCCCFMSPLLRPSLPLLNFQSGPADLGSDEHCKLPVLLPNVEFPFSITTNANCCLQKR